MSPDPAHVSSGFVASFGSAWKRRFRFWIIWPFLLALCLAATPHRARAQETRTVPPGGSMVLERTAKTIAEEKVPTGMGTVVAVRQDNANVLVYVAPERAGEFETNVTYKLDGAPTTVPVGVRNPAPTLSDPKFYAASFRALFGLFILAVVVESGLALIFRWRPFLDFFDGRNVNAVVAFAFSLTFVHLFNLDIATTLMNIYSNPVTPWPWSWPGQILTAMIIAGGSAGVNRMFQSLGIRPIGDAQAPPRLPPDNEAWIAVTLIRDQAVGPVGVRIGTPSVAAPADAAVPTVGTIGGRARGGGFLRYFLRDKGRFPQSGGYRVTPGVHRIELVGANAAGQPLGPVAWGPEAIGNRALVDVTLKL